MFYNNLTPTNQVRINSSGKRSNEPSRANIAQHLSSEQSLQTLDGNRSRLNSGAQTYHHMDTQDHATNKREMIEGLKRTFIILDDPIINRDSLQSGSCKSLRSHNSFHTKSFPKFGQLSQKHKNNSFFYTKTPPTPKPIFPNELSSLSSTTLRKTQMPTLNKDQFLFLRDKLKAPLLYQKNFEGSPRPHKSQTPKPPTTDPQAPIINPAKNTKMTAKLIVLGGKGSMLGTDRNPSKNGSKFLGVGMGVERISEGSKNSSFMDHGSYATYLDDEGRTGGRVIGPEDPWMTTLEGRMGGGGENLVGDKSVGFRKFMDKVEGNAELNRKFGRPDPEALSGFDTTE
jgi:hypothetical protein